MRKGEFGQGEMKVVVVEDIKIDRSRRMEAMIFWPTQGLLDALQGCE
jgi:hypothetical protein